MELKFIGFAIIAVVAIVGIGVVTLGSHAGSNAQNSPQYTSTATSTGSPVLFSSTQYPRFSYLVYPGPISQQAQSALAGFNMSTTALVNGSTQVKLSLTGTSSMQVLLLKPGDKLYFVETSWGDDGFNYESSLGDDGYIVVDQNGYIVA